MKFIFGLVCALCLAINAHSQLTMPVFGIYNTKLDNTQGSYFDQLTQQLQAGSAEKTIIYVIESSFSGISVLKYLRTHSKQLTNFFKIQKQHKFQIKTQYSSYDADIILEDLKSNFNINTQQLGSLDSQAHRSKLSASAPCFLVLSVQDADLQKFDEQIAEDLELLGGNSQNKYTVLVAFKNSRKIRILNENQDEIPDTEEQTTTSESDKAVVLASVPLSLISSSALFGLLIGAFLFFMLYVAIAVSLQLETPSKFVKNGLVIKREG